MSKLDSPKSDAKKAKEIEKKTYQKPRIQAFGDIRSMTRTASIGGPTDNGPVPNDRMMCITAPPFIEEHRVLLSDTNCQHGFRDAILRTVKPGDVVLDLGTGSGLHAFFAVQAGAKIVYAIDSDPIIQLARETAALNGFSASIKFIHGDSRFVELPEKVDVIITNIGFLATLKYLPDAIQRFLKPSGRLIPDQLQLRFVPVEQSGFYESHVQFWNKKHYGIDFSVFQKYAANHPQFEVFQSGDYLAEPHALSPIQLCEKLPSSWNWETEYQASRDGLVTGLMGWYEFSSQGKTILSTEPPLRLSREIWSHPFLPLSEPLSVNKGDTVSCCIIMNQAILSDSLIWNWKLQVGSEVRSQSSLEAIPLIPLRHREPLENLAQR